MRFTEAGGRNDAEAAAARYVKVAAKDDARPSMNGRKLYRYGNPRNSAD